MLLAISEITINQEFQVRICGYDNDHVRDLKDAILDDSKSIPPITVAKVFNTDDFSSCYTLIDGFHRIKAYQELGFDEVEVDLVGPLSQIEALNQTLRYVNRHHAKKLTRADKENIVLTYLKLNPDQITLSFNELSRKLELSPQFIKSICEKNSIKIKAWRSKRLLQDFSDQDLLDELQERLAGLSNDHRVLLNRFVKAVPV